MRCPTPYGHDDPTHSLIAGKKDDTKRFDGTLVESHADLNAR